MKFIRFFLFQLAGAGKTLIKNEVERYVPITKLKYYFAVDTNYVIQKLMLLFFPFTHKVSYCTQSFATTCTVQFYL